MMHRALTRAPERGPWPRRRRGSSGAGGGAGGGGVEEEKVGLRSRKGGGQAASKGFPLGWAVSLTGGSDMHCQTRPNLYRGPRL
jgi:hypothetical protein